MDDWVTDDWESTNPAGEKGFLIILSIIDFVIPLGLVKSAPAYVCVGSVSTLSPAHKHAEARSLLFDFSNCTLLNVSYWWKTETQGVSLPTIALYFSNDSGVNWINIDSHQGGIENLEFDFSNYVLTDNSYLNFTCDISGFIGTGNCTFDTVQIDGWYNSAVYRGEDNWKINCSDSENIETAYNLTMNNITTYGSGNLWINNNLSNIDVFFKENGCTILKQNGVILT